MSVLTITAGLQAYTGTFGWKEAAHLLRRSCYGVQKHSIQEAQILGLNATLDKLLTAAPYIGDPLNVDFEDDPNVPIGQTWKEAPYVQGVNINNYRSRSLRAWQLMQCWQSEFSLSGKMFYFWLNHFSITETGDARVFYMYYNLLRNSAIGNFKELIQDITIAPSMLRFLNGVQSVKNNPNENYARELLELFTLGKGDQVGSGDYTTYTESDVRAIANALTGWQVRNTGSRDPAAQPEAYFVERRHDPTPRQLSARFQSQVLTVAGENAYQEVVDTIFDHPQAAHYLCRKLYRYFVYYDIDNTIETNIIEPMAQILRDSNFEVAPVLRALLGSEHFFEVMQRGAIVKSPLEFVADVVMIGKLELPSDSIYQENWLLRRLLSNMGQQLMVLHQPPSVAGWKAYYQSPLYNRTWINSSTLGARAEFTNQMLGNGVVHQQRRHKIDLLPLLAEFDSPADPNELLIELAARFVSEPLEQVQLDALKAILIPGLPDFEWTVEYNLLLDNPDDEDMYEAVKSKVHAVAKALLSSPEFHLY